MRPIWSLSVLLLLMASAGCLGEDPAADEAADETSPEAPPVVKEGFDASGTMAASADPGNAAGMGICSTPSAQCDRIPFEVMDAEAPLDLEATLEWVLPANDLDLYLFSGTEQVSMDGVNQLGDEPGNQQVMRVQDLDAGAYEFVVVGWNAVGESYTLAVTFA